jgi:diguanylate cyclase (GGDEF)-like protein
MMIVLTAHAITLPLRIPLADSLGGTAAAHPRLLAFVMFETILFCMCAAYLFGALSKERMAFRYKQSSLLDPLTAVANRRAFLKQAGRLLRRCVVGRKPVALLLFDLDRFKEINDRYGHSAGDEVLIAFCHVATGELRPTDLFARLGGEEFVSLLPDTTSKDAFAVGNRVRSAFETTAHEAGGVPFKLTVSVGMAATYGPGTDLRSLLADADRALYLAKQQGRNRVESAIGVESAPVPLSGYGRGLGFRG